ncbi:MAG: hypothetical protein CVV34_05345 [Methanomicrobiales archaeon HGW-Methanomicrobiales-5]|nr:MAG: hypothetical protein CVV34_05345 [Methanomicrobiales archaeon HGW-Methanomicrobiales-5]
MYDAHGKVTGAIESFRDISDHYAVKRDLNLTREMIQGFADIIPVAIFEMDLNFLVTFSNRIGYTLSGMSREDFDKKVNILDLIPPGDRERAIIALKDILGGKKSTGEEYLLQRNDGSMFPALIYTGMITDPETKNATGLRGVVIDLTEQKKEALVHHESRERLELALKAGDIGIWDVDMRTLLVKDVYGWADHTLKLSLDDPQSIPINKCQSLLHPLDVPRVLYAFYQHLKGKKPLFESELRLLCNDGSWKWVVVRGKVIERDCNNQPVRITGTVNEITLPIK